jgi:hypothetical protein
MRRVWAWILQKHASFCIAALDEYYNYYSAVLSGQAASQQAMTANALHQHILVYMLAGSATKYIEAATVTPCKN